MHKISVCCVFDQLTGAWHTTCGQICIFQLLPSPTEKSKESGKNKNTKKMKKGVYQHLVATLMLT